MNKKIAIFHCGFIYSGGGERIVLEEARGLRKRGYEILVYAPTLEKEKCYPEFVSELGVKTFFPTFIDRLPFRLGLRMIAASALAPFLAFKFRDVDLFIGANQPGAWIAFCMAKVLNKPYLVYLNQPNRIVYPRPVDMECGWATTVKDYQVLYNLFQFVKPLLAVLDKKSIISANEVLANGDYIGGVIEQIYGRWVQSVAAGAYAHPFSQLYLNPHSAYKGRIKIKGFWIEKPYVLITNRHDPQKRFDYVIKALKEVVKKYPKAKLVIPGPFTEHTKELIKLSEKLGIKEKVYFLGQVSEKDLQRLYRHCTVYCYPSPEEDFGLGPLEAGGWGVPTVAWNHAGPTVTVDDGVTGFLAEPYKIKDYALKILRLLEDPRLRAKMGRAAWERTNSKFSWDNHIDILERSILRFID